MKFSNGDLYEGRYYNLNILNRFYIIIKIKGNFVNGERSGLGTYNYKNGDFYKGNL